MSESLAQNAAQPVQVTELPTVKDRMLAPMSLRDNMAEHSRAREQRHHRRALPFPRRWAFTLAVLLALALAAAAESNSHRTALATVSSASVSGVGAVGGQTPVAPQARPAVSQPSGATSGMPSATGSPSTSNFPPVVPATKAATPTDQTSQSFAGFGLPDPSQWVQQVLTTVLSAFFSGVLLTLSHILDWAQGLGGSAFNFVTRTPSEGTYASSSVVALWQWVVGVADAALAVFVLWCGYAVMTKHALGTRAYGAMQALPRLGLAALAANLSLLFTGGFIDLGNALCDGIGQVGLPGYSTATTVQQDLAALVLAVIYAVVGFLLVAQMLLRLALLDVLIVTAPLGFLCWALPQTQAWARLWTTTFIATALVQFLQILALRLGALLVTELTPGRLDAATITLLAGIATLYLTFKLPAMLQNWALRTVGAASMGGVIEQGVVVAQAIGSVAASTLG